MERYLRSSDQAVSKCIAQLRRNTESEFGVVSRVIDGVLGPLKQMQR